MAFLETWPKYEPRVRSVWLQSRIEKKRRSKYDVGWVSDSWYNTPVCPCWKYKCVIMDCINVHQDSGRLNYYSNALRVFLSYNDQAWIQWSQTWSAWNCAMESTFEGHSCFGAEAAEAALFASCLRRRVSLCDRDGTSVLKTMVLLLLW